MEEDNKSVLGIAYLYFTISAIFALVSYLYALFYSTIDKYSITTCVLALGTYAVIWFALYKLNKKQNQGLSTILKDCTPRKTVGFIVLINILVSLFVFIPATINAISLIIKDEIDLSVIPNIISVFLLICQVIIGLYLLKCKRRTDGVYKAETVIGIAFLYTSITFVFSLAEKLSLSIFSRNSLDEYFFLRFVPYVTILLVLYILSKKQSKSFVWIFNNNTIRKTAGVLVLIEGIISLSIIMNSVINAIWLRDFMVGNDYQFAQSITQSIIRFIIVAIQILFGIYLLKLYKVKSIDEK